MRIIRELCRLHTNFAQIMHIMKTLSTNYAQIMQIIHKLCTNYDKLCINYARYAKYAKIMQNDGKITQKKLRKKLRIRVNCIICIIMHPPLC